MTTHTQKKTTTPLPAIGPVFPPGWDVDAPGKAWRHDGGPAAPRRPIRRPGPADPRPLPAPPRLDDPVLAGRTFRVIPSWPAYTLARNGLIASFYGHGGVVRDEAPSRLLRPYWDGDDLCVTLFRNRRPRPFRLVDLVATVWSAKAAVRLEERIVRFLIAGRSPWRRTLPLPAASEPKPDPRHRPTPEPYCPHCPHCRKKADLEDAAAGG